MLPTQLWQIQQHNVWEEIKQGAIFKRVWLTLAELNTSGSRKFKSDQSSCRLFCSGVPVNNRRLVVLNSRTISDNWEPELKEKETARRKRGKILWSLFLCIRSLNHLRSFMRHISLLFSYSCINWISSVVHLCSNTFDFSFLMRWASSITRYRQLNFLKTDFSRITISYEVTHTSHSPGIITSRMNAA